MAWRMRCSRATLLCVLVLFLSAMVLVGGLAGGPLATARQEQQTNEQLERQILRTEQEIERLRMEHRRLTSADGMRELAIEHGYTPQGYARVVFTRQPASQPSSKP
jgi:cell division protein FtsB